MTMIGAPEPEDPEFVRGVEPFQFCGTNYARVDGRSLLITERAYMGVSRARDLRDWLNKVLPQADTGTEP